MPKGLIFYACYYLINLNSVIEVTLFFVTLTWV